MPSHSPVSSPGLAALSPPPSRLRVVPRRTASGQQELGRRTHSLTQRQRTVLLLVDGQRSVDEIGVLAEKSGAGSSAFAQLVVLGLVMLPGIVAEAAESSPLPSSHTLAGDSTWSGFGNDAEFGDRPLIEARQLLMRAVRSAAPVAGALTLLKLKRAATREALAALLDEVEQRLRKPHRRIIAAQTLRHVRHLLTLPAPSP